MGYTLYVINKINSAKSLAELNQFVSRLLPTVMEDVEVMRTFAAKAYALADKE